MIVEIFSEHKNQSTTWVGSVSTDWFDANNWSNGIPNSTKIVTIPPATNGCIINGSASAYNVKVLSGGSLTINSDLLISDIFVNFGTSVLIDTTGTLTQINENISNIGTISLNRSTYGTSADFTYWSGPLIGPQTLQAFSPNSNLKYFEVYDNGWAYVNAAKTPFVPTIGVAILGSKNISGTIPSIVSYQFIGTPNNGIFQVSVTLSGGTGSYFTKLIGNPYPTIINADKFIVTNLDKILYLSFWPHYHGPTGTTYDSNSYVNYTLLGSTSVDDADVTKQTKWIDAGVGFVATGNLSGTLTFNNDMKFDDNFNFDRHRLWLNFTLSGNSSFSQTLIGYAQTSGNLFNNTYDVTGNTTTFQIFSVKNNTLFNIQSKQLPFQNTDTFNIGYTTSLSGTHRINYASSDGIFSGSQAIYLKDAVLSAKTNLKLTAYTFISSAGTFNNRFTISFI